MAVSFIEATRADGYVRVRGRASCPGRVVLTLYQRTRGGSLVMEDQVVLDRDGAIGTAFVAGAGGDLVVGARCESDEYEVFAEAMRFYDERPVTFGGFGAGWLVVAAAGAVWLLSRQGSGSKKRSAASRETEA